MSDIDPLQYKCKRCQQHFGLNEMRKPIEKRVCIHCEAEDYSVWRNFITVTGLHEEKEYRINVNHIVSIELYKDYGVEITLSTDNAILCEGSLEDFK